MPLFTSLKAAQLFIDCLFLIFQNLQMNTIRPTRADARVKVRVKKIFNIYIKKILFKNLFFKYRACVLLQG